MNKNNRSLVWNVRKVEAEGFKHSVTRQERETRVQLLDWFNWNLAKVVKTKVILITSTSLDLKNFEGGIMDNSDNSHSQQHLANQRTFLAWLRTCVALIGLGFVVAKFGLFLFPIFTSEDPSPYTTNLASSFETSTHYSSIIGTSMVILGIVFVIFALRTYIYTYKSIEKNTFTPKHFDIYLLSIAIVILGLFMVAYLILIPFLMN